MTMMPILFAVGICRPQSTGTGSTAIPASMAKLSECTAKYAALISPQLPSTVLSQLKEIGRQSSVTVRMSPTAQRMQAPIMA
jgi:hypothetical protein